MNLEHANTALFAALAKSQGEVENATKNVANGAFSKNGKPSYADLAEVLNTVRPVFSANGISIIQSTEFDGALVSVVTSICHADGGYITAKASCQPKTADAQGIGSATTYLRRYSLASVCGIAQEDDDGNSASHNSKPSPPVTEAQIATLQYRMEANGTNKEMFFKGLGINSLADIKTQDKYNQAISAQNKKDESLKKVEKAA